MNVSGRITFRFDTVEEYNEALGNIATDPNVELVVQPGNPDAVNFEVIVNWNTSGV